MGLFSKFQTKQPSLEQILREVESNMANNYKDAAREAFDLFCSKFGELESQGKLNEKQQNYYGRVRAILEEKLKGYSHKDQKPYWTK